jgi:hypothetical protein
MIVRAIAVLSVGLLGLGLPGESPAAEVTRHELDVTLQPSTGRLFGEGVLHVEGLEQGELTLRLAPGFALQDVRWKDGERWRDARIGPGAIDAAGRTRWSVATGDPQLGSTVLDLSWAGLPGPFSEAKARAEVGAAWRYLGERGAVLAPRGGWYPTATQGTSRFVLEVTAPDRWRVVAEGEPAVSAGQTSGTRVTRYEVPHPVPGVHLVAGPWERTEREHRNGKVVVYHRSDTEGAAVRRTLLRMRQQIDALIAEAGPWQWPRLAWVQHPSVDLLPGPGFALLGPETWTEAIESQDAVRRLVARAWWPGSVYPDRGRDRIWAEALAEFVAEHRLRAADDEAELTRMRRARLWRLRGDEQRPVERGVMALSMLERRLGGERFGKALRHFLIDRRHRVTGWSDLLASFEGATGEPLQKLAGEWLTDRPLAEIEVTEARARRALGGAKIAVRLRATHEWSLDVPVELRDEEGRRVQGVVRVRDGAGAAHLSAPFVPATLRIDPRQNVLRRVTESERAPRIGDLELDPPQLVVIGSARGGGLERQARHLASMRSAGAGQARSDREVGPEHLSEDASVLILGRPGGRWGEEVAQRLPPEIRLRAESLVVAGRSRTEASTGVVVALRGGEGRTWVVIDALSPSALGELTARLPSLGEHSWALLEGDDVVASATTEAPGVFEVPVSPEGGADDE